MTRPVRWTLALSAILAGCIPEAYEPVTSSGTLTTATQGTTQTNSVTPTTGQSTPSMTQAKTPTATVEPSPSTSPTTTQGATPSPTDLELTATLGTSFPSQTPMDTATPGPSLSPSGTPADTGTPGITASPFTTGTQSTTTTPSPSASPREDTPSEEPTPTALIDVDGDGIFASEDCDDNDSEVGGPTDWYFDADDDGYGSDDFEAQSACDAVLAFSAPAPGDCDDSNDQVHPNAQEQGDGVDRNCDGMMRVEAGDFVIGADRSDADVESNQMPEQIISVPAFDIDTYEVTVLQYRECVEAGDCSEPEGSQGKCLELSNTDWDNYPINCVSQVQALSFCEAQGKTLPSESQWQVSARGLCSLYAEGCSVSTDSSETDSEEDEPIYPWGDDTATCQRANGNFGDDNAQCPDLVEGESAPVEVGSYAFGSSPYGVMDLSGNVAEWVADCYHDDLTSIPTDGSQWLTGCKTEDSDGGSELDSLSKGGSYSSELSALLLVARQSSNGDPQADTGFRCSRWYDQDSDGSAYDEDCDDSNSEIYPSATDLCNEVDDDCDGVVDEMACGSALHIDGGKGHNCALFLEGYAGCWGDNTNGQTLTPDESFLEIVAGEYHSCGLTTNNVTTCWGDNSKGQLDAVQSKSLSGLSSLLSHTCSIDSEDQPYCWGDNTYNQLGSELPVQVSSISAGAYHTCAVLKDDQSIQCWGRNDSQQATAPINMAFKGVSAGGFHSCGLATDNTVNCWGYNTVPGLDEDTGQAENPEGEFQKVTTGAYHSCGLLTSGSISCWGSNAEGQTDSPEGSNFVEIEAGWLHTCAIGVNGAISCWGVDVQDQD